MHGPNMASDTLYQTAHTFKKLLTEDAMTMDWCPQQFERVDRHQVDEHKSTCEDD